MKSKDEKWALFWCKLLHPGNAKVYYSETNQSPKQRYDQGLTLVRHVDMDAAMEFFMKHITRTVADIRIDNQLYRVDPKLRGDKVEVRYDPYGDLQKLWIYSPHGEYLGSGSLYLRDQGAEIPVASPSKPKHNYLDVITQKHRKLLSDRPWPFMAFVQKLSLLMWRKGYISAFPPHEFETLKNAITTSLLSTNLCLPASSSWPQKKPPKAISVSSARSAPIFTPLPTQKPISPGASVAKKLQHHRHRYVRLQLLFP